MEARNLECLRTNNDVEGWHGMLNRHAKRGNLSLYLMVRLLHEHAGSTGGYASSFGV